MARWTAKETRFLSDNYRKLNIEKLMKGLPKRTKKQVYAKAKYMGLSKAVNLTTLPINEQALNFKRPPDILNDHGKRFWHMYCTELGELDFAQYTKLADLCYWEQRKVDAQIKLDKNGETQEYKNADGSVKHAQTSPYLTNLKNIQSEINTIRDKLFANVKKSAKESKPEQNPKIFKKRVTGFNG